ncbi:GTP-binding protein Era [hydrothermal vent metagenome]|uniref:GTP-binding protein Era n=1 Tax=hydrothermal vent metagenome TaxID=652676 RepID=A0A1W1CQ77_9ZZZZ
MSHKAGFVAVVGRPNVGKSTLINEMIGQKINITSHKPQTTRHKIYALDSTNDYQFVFVDTPGMHIGAKKAINKYMNRVASSSLSEVDMVLWLIEAGVWHKEDERVLEFIKNLDVPVILVINKIDKAKDRKKLLPFIEKITQYYSSDNLVPVSAFDKKSILYLKEVMLKFLPEQKAIYDKDYLTDKSQKFLVAEFIREKLIRNLHNEIPYDLTVEIEQFKLDGSMFRIHAKILADKESQKNIIIGYQGNMLKKISTDARISIEGLLEAKVFLKLWVKVKEGWADDKRALASLGYD